MRLSGRAPASLKKTGRGPILVRESSSLDDQRDQSVAAHVSLEQSLRGDNLILRELQRLNSSMDNIQARAQRLESSHSRDPLPPASKRPRHTGNSCTHMVSWDNLEPEDLDDLSGLQFSSDQDEEQAFMLSEHSVALLTSAFSSTLSNTNTERCRSRSLFPTCRRHPAPTWTLSSSPQ